MATVDEKDKVKKEKKEELQVKEVKGEKEAKSGQKVEYKATSNIDEKDKIVWAIKVDEKQIPLSEKGETVTITMEKPSSFCSTHM